MPERFVSHFFWRNVSFEGWIGTVLVDVLVPEHRKFFRDGIHVDWCGVPHGEHVRLSGGVPDEADPRLLRANWVRWPGIRKSIEGTLKPGGDQDILTSSHSFKSPRTTMWKLMAMLLLLPACPQGGWAS